MNGKENRSLETENQKNFLEYEEKLKNRINSKAESVFKADAQDVISDIDSFMESDEGKAFVKYFYEAANRYDELLSKLNLVNSYDETKDNKINSGIIALNGTSGVGQSYVMKFIKEELESRNIEFERVYLLGSREPRDDEGHKDPYIFVEKTDIGYKSVHTEEEFSEDEIYLEYESRPGARNAILKEDIKKAKDKLLYIETVIPVLLKMKDEKINDNEPLGEMLKPVYLAADSGKEWTCRLVAREPDKIKNDSFREKLIGRVESSLKDMEVAAEKQIPSVVHVLDHGPITAKKVLAGWDIL